MSDAAQGPGWWQAADGKWYPPDQPPAPGWWRASDGNWYPPDTAGTDAPAAVTEAGAPATSTAVPQDATPTEPTPTEPTPTEPVAVAPEAPNPAPGPTAPDAPAGDPAAATVAGGPPGSPPVAPVAPGDAPAPSGSRRGLLIGAGVVVVLILIAGIAIVATRGGDPEVATDRTTPTTSAGGDEGDGGGDEGSGGDEGTDDQGSTTISDEMPSDDITLDEDVVVVNSERGAKFKGYSNDGSALLLDPTAENADQLAPGKILLLTGVTVVGVAAVDESEEGLIVTGEPVTLPEVIKDGELAWEDVDIDPEQMRLFSYDDAEGGSTTDEGTGGGSDGGSDGGTTDDSELTEEEILEEGGGGIVDGLGGNGFRADPGDAHAASGVRALPAPAASPATFEAGSRTVKGSIDEYDFALTHEPAGSGHHLVLNVKMKGEMAGTINADVNINPLVTTGSTAVSNSTVDAFNFSLDDWSGDATVDVELQSTSQLASTFNPTRLKVPIGIEFPFPIGGIPFTLSLTGSVQVQLSFALANSSLGGQAKIEFGGDAGMSFKEGSISVAGNRDVTVPDLLNTVKGVSSGPVGVVFTTELPKIGLGFGFLQTGANVYISQGMVVSQTVLPAPVSCTSTGVAYVMAVGLEAKFLGVGLELGRQPIVDKRFDFTLPKTAQCTAE